MTIEEIARSMKAAMYERASSPLLVTFMLSWAIWNYQFLLVLLSGMSVPEKITFVEQKLYPYSELSKSVLLLGCGPVLSTIVFLFAYPYPAQFAYRFWRTRQKELNDIKKEIDGSVLLSKEESVRLREYAYALQAEYSEQLEKYSKEIESLKKKLQEKPLPMPITRSIVDRMPISTGLEFERGSAKSNSYTVGKIAPKAIANSAGISDRDLVKVLVATPYLYLYVPAADKKLTRVVEFKAKGEIGPGKSPEESSWGVQDGYLNIYDDKNMLTASFKYDSSRNRFVEVGENGAELPIPKVLTKIGS